VKSGLPVTIVNDINFRAFVADIDPNISVPCRQTVTQTIQPQQLSIVREKLQKVLDNASDVSLTSDIWTDRRAHAFLTVTVHTFGQGEPQSYLLDFKAFEGSHMGSHIADALENTVAQFGIQNKIRSVNTDNAANMKKALSVFLESSNNVECSFGNACLSEVQHLTSLNLWLLAMCCCS